MSEWVGEWVGGWVVREGVRGWVGESLNCQSFSESISE